MEGGWSRDKILQLVSADMDQIKAQREEITKTTNDLTQECLDFLDAMFEQISSSTSGPLLAKTPKVNRKKIFKRIETIPEDDLMEIDTPTKKISRKLSADSDDDNFVPPAAGRKSKREASKKAVDNIRHQQSLTINSKMRRPSEESDDYRHSKASSRESQSKRPRSVRSSDEEDVNGPRKQIKTNGRSSSRLTRKKTSNVVSSSTEEEVIQASSKKLSTFKRKMESTESRTSKRSRSQMSAEPEAKRANIINETIENPSPDETIEPSMYEDAIGKAVPIMNSTMKPTSIGNQTRVISQTPFGNLTRIVDTATNDTPVNNFNEPLKRMMNVTVVLENMAKVNETVTISKPSKGSYSNTSVVAGSVNIKTSQLDQDSPFAIPGQVPKVLSSKSKIAVQLDALITDDESSPERKITKQKKLQKKITSDKIKVEESKPKRVTRSSLMSEDEVDLTPERKVLGEVNRDKGKKGLKKNTLFSPYAKESVKKKIEAFEQAVLSGPPAEAETGMRLTRTKTRALAAANDSDRASNASSIAQKLARKSLAKAKQISRAKDAKIPEDCKENLAIPVQKIPTNEKLVQKQQQRTTPNSKSRLQMPSSVSRGLTTPSNAQSLSHSKPMTGSRTNIVTNVESFIQTKGSAQKPSSSDKLMEDRKRKQQEEDVKKKREELLKTQMEEKRRKREEKERKNRLAREAKEKLELEKRMKLEKEKEDKAKLAFQMQEKHREETEKKRLALYQRAQEKEERRKQEEEHRMQRLREQEEMERQLAEQKRREQEVEKRRLLELKAQQQAAIESLKLKNQMLAAQSKKQAMAQNKLPPNSYKIDSEPDSDSEDETRPKHEIPTWAKNNYRQKHLAMQENVPMELVMRFFDVKKCTPDLSELFHGIDKSRLKRTSSAIWKTPPRFSMMDAIN